ncbi:MAG: DUF4340 domain-containing protein [Defluviitaleaceae bacterium]|nr:DUF4340 domain-containing protein [Defluviitaleaceae bacterium]
MGRTKRNLITLAVSAVLIGSLAGIYFWQDSRGAQEDANASPTPTGAPMPVLIDREESDIDRVVFESGEQKLTLVLEKRQNTYDEDATDLIWVVQGDEDIGISQPAARDMTRALYNLSAIEIIEDPVGTLADFGLDPAAATATAHYNDQTTAVVLIGKETPAKDRYYMMLEGDPAIYLVYTYLGARYFNGLNELIDRSVNFNQTESFEYMFIRERGRQPVEFGFTGTESEKSEMYDAYGIVSMTMIQPYPGRDLYYSNFDDHVMTNFNDFTLGELVSLRPDDLSPYGLDDPSLEVRFKEMFNDTHLFFGDMTEDGRIYCMVADKPSVFLTEYEYVRPMFKMNVFKFIERFVVIEDIYTCLSIKIEVPGSGLTHFIELEQYADGDGDKSFVPFVDGVIVQELAFKTFYKNTIGITIDAEVEEMDPDSEPEITFTFTFADKDPIVARYYSYDANFFAARVNDGLINNVTSKQHVNDVISMIPELATGKWDRDY